MRFSKENPLLLRSVLFFKSLMFTDNEILMYIHVYIFFKENLKGGHIFPSQIRSEKALWVFTVIDCLGQLRQIGINEGM